MKPYHFISLVCGVAMLAGCLISSNTEQSRRGHYVAEDTFAQIQPGKTTAPWVKATLGDPDAVTKVDDGVEIWKWSYTEKKESSGAILLIFGGHDSKEIEGKAFVEMKDGVVTNKWRG